MKKFKLSRLLFVSILLATGCSSKEDIDNKTIYVGATESPHGEILEACKELVKEDGYTLKIKIFSDYILPNKALKNSELDANYFQHQPFLDDFNSKNNADLVSALKVHFEPLALYKGKSTDVNNIPNNAKIGIPNDTVNGARALYLLESVGLITVESGKGLAATKADIKTNPKNIEIIELAANLIPANLPDLDFGVINGNYALGANIISQATSIIENSESEAAEVYGNIIAVRNNTQNKPAIQALVKALSSETIRNFIINKYGIVVVPLI